MFNEVTHIVHQNSRENSRTKLKKTTEKDPPQTFDEINRSMQTLLDRTYTCMFFVVSSSTSCFLSSVLPLNATRHMQFCIENFCIARLTEKIHSSEPHNT